LKIVKFPNRDYEGLTATEALLKFYVDLGWNKKKQTLNPKKVKLSEHDHLSFTNALVSINPKQKDETILMLLNFGPSCGYNKVKNGSVGLYKGWVESSNSNRTL